MEDTTYGGRRRSTGEICRSVRESSSERKFQVSTREGTFVESLGKTERLSDARAPQRRKSAREMARISRIIHSIHRNLEVGDRSWGTVTFKQCFTGSDLVDLLLDRAFASSRPEAAALGIELATEYGVFEHVTGNHEFQDNDQLYRFKPGRRFSNENEQSQRSLASPHVGNFENESNTTDGKLSQLEKTVSIQQVSALLDTSDQNSEVATSSQSFRSLVSNDSHAEYKSVMSYDSNAKEHMIDIAMSLFSGVDVQDRTHRFKTYKRCFVGREAIDVLMLDGYAESREEAIKIGRKLAAHPYRLFSHVCDDHDLEDGYYFYRFNNDSFLKKVPSTLGQHAVDVNIPGAEEVSGIEGYGTNKISFRSGGSAGPSEASGGVMDRVTVDVGSTSDDCANDTHAVRESALVLRNDVEKGLEVGSKDGTPIAGKGKKQKVKCEILGGESSVYTMAEVRLHNTDTEGHWIVVENRVYDCSKYLPKHPGGPEYITNVSGMDATIAFRKDPHFHSRRAWRALEKLYIGDLDPTDHVNHDTERVKGPASGAFVIPTVKSSDVRRAAREEKNQKALYDEEEEGDGDNDGYTSDGSIGVSSLLVSSTSRPEEDRNATPQDIASKILLLRRLFPELYGELKIWKDDDARGKVERESRVEYFQLSGGYLRLRVPQIQGKDNGHPSVAESEISVDSTTQENNAIMEFFSCWESRRVDRSSRVLDRSEEPSEAFFQCSRWVLSVALPAGDHDSLLQSDWLTAISATKELLKSRHWDEIQMQLAILAGMLCSHCHQTLPLVAVTDMVSCLESTFLLSPPLVLELIHALVDAGLVIPKLQQRSFSFSEAVFGMYRAFSGSSLTGQRNVGSPVPRNESHDTVKTDSFYADATGFRNTNVCESDAAEIFDSKLNAGLQHRESDDSLGWSDGPSSPRPRRGSIYHDTVCTQERFMQSLAEHNLYTQIHQLSTLSQSVEIYSTIRKLISKWHATQHKKDKTTLTYSEKVRLRRSFDMLHMDLPILSASSGGASKTRVSQNRLSHTYPCYFSHRTLPQPYEIWPQRPLLLRPSPNTGTTVRGVRFSSSLKYLFLPGSGFCNGCTLPINNGKEPKGKSMVVDFETNLFMGTALVRVRSAKAAMMVGAETKSYFAGKRRTFQVIIQGHFKRDNIPMSECVTGQVFDRPFRGDKVPRWALQSTISLLSILAPELQADYGGHCPRFVAPLISTAQTIVKKASKPLEDPNSHFSDVSIERHMKEPTGFKSLLDDVDGYDFHPLEEKATRSRTRKRVFGNLYREKFKKPVFSVDREYTFEFYQRCFDFVDLAVDLGMSGRHDLSGFLNGQPMKIMAAHDPGDNGDRQMRWLWSFDVWHESLYEVAEGLNTVSPVSPGKK